MDEVDEKLGEERRLIFENYANGVDIEQLKTPFKRSAAEIEAEIYFVAKKLREYRFRRMAEGSKFAQGAVPCDTLIDIRIHRMALFDTLRKVGNRYLSSPLLLPKVQVQAMNHPSMVREAAQRVKLSKPTKDVVTLK